MKKLLIMSYLLIISASSYAGSLSVAQPMPDGLAQGNFSIDASYEDSVFQGPPSIYHADGLVNFDRLGLVNSLRDINAAIADPYSVNFKLTISLQCKNGSSIVYNFNDSQLKAPANIILNAPLACGI